LKEGQDSQREQIAKWEAVWEKGYGTGSAHVLYLELLAEMVSRTLDKAGLEHGRLLDLGCGTGELAIFLAKRCQLEIAGLDLIAECLTKANSLAQQNRVVNSKLDFVLGDAFFSPFKDGVFDVIVSTGISSAGAYIGMQSEIERLLSPGGIAVVDYVRLPHIGRPKASIRRFREWRRETRRVKNGGRWGEGGLKHYHYGKYGIREHFEENTSLRIVKFKAMRTWPVLLRGRKLRLVFEKTIGRILSPLLAGVVVVTLRKEA